MKYTQGTSTTISIIHLVDRREHLDAVRKYNSELLDVSDY